MRHGFVFFPQIADNDLCAVELFKQIGSASFYSGAYLQLKHRRLDRLRLDQTDAEDADGILPRCR